MGSYHCIGILIYSVVITSGVLSQSCEEFIEINETLYDMAYYDINAVNKRPLGFKKATQVFSASSANHKPCFKATGLANNQQVEIMFETVPSSFLCVRAKSGTDHTFGCYEGRLKSCIHTSSTPLELEFYCSVSDSCSESDVNFWLRITKGPHPSADPEGMWCQGRGNAYPTSLAQIPNFVTPPPDPGDTSRASSIELTLYYLFTFVILIVHKFFWS